MERGTFSNGSPPLRRIASTAPGSIESMVRRVWTNVSGHILSVISNSRSQSSLVCKTGATRIKPILGVNRRSYNIFVLGVAPVVCLQRVTYAAVKTPVFAQHDCGARVPSNVFTNRRTMPEKGSENDRTKAACRPSLIRGL